MCSFVFFLYPSLLLGFSMHCLGSTNTELNSHHKAKPPKADIANNNTYFIAENKSENNHKTKNAEANKNTLEPSFGEYCRKIVHNQIATYF